MPKQAILKLLFSKYIVYNCLLNFVTFSQSRIYVNVIDKIKTCVIPVVGYQKKGGERYNEQIIANSPYGNVEID